MALTATATTSVRLCVSRMIGLRNPQLFSISPCKSNISFSVGEFLGIKEAFKSLAKRLQKERNA